MNETVEELAPEAPTPLSIDDVIADLRGFGIEEFEEILTLDVAGKRLQLKVSNVPTEADLTAIIAVDGLKNYQFFQEVKIELLSRSITWINGIDIKKLSKQQRLVVDPADGMSKDIQVVLISLIKSWGLEVMQLLWKVLMVHSQTIEDKLFESFPQAATMTKVEQRYYARIEKEMEQLTKDALSEGVDQLLNDEIAESADEDPS